MPVNPFGQDDPLAPAGNGAWGAGAGAGGFGQKTAGQAHAAEGDQYEVVDIADPTAAKAPKPPAKPSGNSKARSGVPGGAPLSAREADLARREREIARREAQIARRPIGYDPMMVKNWPPCMPVVHHDIPHDIPVHKQGITRAGFIILLLTWLALAYNFVAVFISFFVAQGTDASSFIFAAIYAVLGIPGAWIFWYGRLYRAMMTDGAFSFATFFFIFLVHTAFSVYSAIAPEIAGAGSAHTGFLTAIDYMKSDDGGDKLAGILYLAGACLWSLLSFLSVTYLVRVYTFFRNSGGDQRLAAEAAAAGATAYAGGRS